MFVAIVKCFERLHGLDGSKNVDRIMLKNEYELIVKQEGYLIMERISRNRSFKMLADAFCTTYNMSPDI